VLREVKARARANVALAKYWGKRDEALNLPFTGSISVTLAGLETTASLRPAASRAGDTVLFAGAPAPPREAERIGRFLGLARQMARSTARVEVELESTFPVAAGLASSASTYAALALAANRAFDLELDEAALSALARRGSGSAARSVHGGFVEWLAGTAVDGHDSHAVQIAPPSHWELGVVVAVTEEGPKKIGSREGMAIAVRQSPFFDAWVATHAADMDAIRAGIEQRDLALVGEAAEHNCLKMHAASMAARPALLYWTPATLAVIHRTRELRAGGVDAYFTIDAGPQVKVLCHLEDRDHVAAELGRVSGVRRVLLSAPGAGAEVLSPA
jgi:diphosphomevalonate decarboxylase